MCCEDYRIGRKMVVSERRIVLTGASQQVVAPNPNRVMLGFSFGNSADSAYVCMENPAVIGRGFILDHPANTHIFFFIKDHGRMVTERWYGIAGIGGTAFTIYEGILEEDTCKEEKK